jgi:hypothetical protein
LAGHQVCDARLEGLETLLEVDQLALKEAAVHYASYIAEIPFITGSRFANSPATLDWVQGEINEPKPNQLVESTISCSGLVESMGTESYLWLAVEVSGCIWPKEGGVVAKDDGSWLRTIYEEGATASFSLSLYVANFQADKRIRAWLRKGDATGNYSKMRRVPGTRRIARIDGLRRANVS